MTFMLFVLAAQKNAEVDGLTASRAFTVLTIIELITTPLGALLQTIPSVTSSLACLDRIQTYLKSPNRLEQRGNTTALNEKSLMVFTTHRTTSQCSLNMHHEAPEPISSTSSKIAISLKDATFGYTSGGDYVLDSISCTIPYGSLTMIIGPIGSGKSSFLKAMLNELDLQSGEMEIKPNRIGYCDSSPWTPSGIVRTCIEGMSQADDTWFDQVIYACALNEDISAMAEGLETTIGSQGMTLSEGQKQRLVCGLCELISIQDSFVIGTGESCVLKGASITA